jgi:hypothetical protein
MSNWKFNIYYNSPKAILGSPLQPQPGPMTQDHIQNEMNNFNNEFNKLGDNNENPE